LRKQKETQSQADAIRLVLSIPAEQNHRLRAEEVETSE
jgi:hypothetical protein